MPPKSSLKPKNGYLLDPSGTAQQIPVEVEGLFRIAGKRTHRFGLEAANGSITLKEALSLAYAQALYDMATAQNNQN